MVSDSMIDLVVAVDYYDGEIEGLARRDIGCRYFRRETLGLEDEANEYVSVAIDCSVFEEIANLVGASGSHGVFVYSGSSHFANKRLDEMLRSWRQQCEEFGQRSCGHSYLDSTALV